ncbi:oxidoreductase [Actinoplanes sp. NBRC 14428]|uniref:Putative ferric reductase n=1 Tax=Pseudosporangium ferrugineum TaxID=439699 RepID=A0A2T0RXD6_9ACTN|nr:ferric reductase-like transmembrane domain-containing protein [Pseudosporangium ferrugineum]PRY25703.1 putative ferric reductase [Pseudosporangium ferrugineum]BCJ56254.1 oxidoreductase [Actinoplanes sp. NBRC 14428]
MRTAQLFWGVVLLNVAVVWALFFTVAPEPKNAILGAGQLLGLHVALLMILQLTLIARLPWLDRRIGMDRLTSWHRWTGFTLFWVVLAHPLFVLAGYATAYDSTMWRQFLNLAVMVGSLAGMIALVLVVVAAGASIRYARRRLQYETWHAVHLILYLAITLGLIHQLFELSTFTASPVATAYWWTLWTFAIGALLIGRIVLPLWRNARHRFRVAAVVPESDDVVSVHIRGRDLDKLPARAGQFFIWRFPGYARWWQANPFSLSAAPDGRSLRLTAKAVGGASAALRHIPVGSRVFAEGPYGAFTSLHRTREKTLLIAGGVGVTPIRALLEESAGDIVVLYRVHRRADAVLLPELEALARERGARVVLLSGRTGSGDPPLAPFEPANLAAEVPDVAERDVFVCGPPAMTSAVLRSLRALRVPRRQVHAERFSLAA